MLQKRIVRIQGVIENRHRDFIVVLEDIHDPHNAAAILRTCDALGIQNVWFVFEKEKRYNPKRIGKATSSSANKWLDFRTFDSSSACIDALKDEGFSIIVTALTDSSIPLTDYSAHDGKIAIIVGNEHSGASQAIIDAADTVVRIPMMGFVQSLNVSVATAIVLWEITKQRMSGTNSWQLTSVDKQKLLEDFLERARK